MTQERIYWDEYYKIIGLCMKVHNELGHMHKEVLYQDALEVELKNNNIPYEREKTFPIFYNGEKLKHRFKVDFFIYGCILVEIKAIKAFAPGDFKQTVNYLKATNIELAILVNFGSPRLTHQRVIRTT
ncbi:MAG: GxxExxY protein [Chitinophagaceae bacterium]|nr:GxxExxY protein [Chitinophagaceae bacterium]